VRKITLSQIRVKIKEAKELDACNKVLVELKSLRTLEEYVNHPRAPFWCWWICEKTQSRWKDAEEIILRSPFHSYLYTRDILKERWEKAEEVILTSSQVAYYYARNVIKGRWPEAEKNILTSPIFSYLYARDVIKGEWKEAKSIIASNTYWYEEYQMFLRGLKNG